MTNEDFSLAVPSNMTSRGCGSDLRKLIKKANNIGILAISTHGEINEHIIKDAIATAESLNKYYKDHPEE
jgi:hypothetical protein